MRRRVGAAATLAALMIAAACTGSASPDATTDRTTDSTSASSTTASPSASASTPTSPPSSSDPPASSEYVEPLVLALDIHRKPLHLSEREARRVIARELTSWRDLGQPGGRIDVRRGPAAIDVAATRSDVLAVVPASLTGPTVQVATVAGVHPLRRPRRYPINTAAEAPLPSVTRVIVAGDIMLGRRVASEAPGGAASTLRPLSPLLAGADLTVGNLESTLSDDGFPSQGDDSFAADPSVLGSLDRAGFDLLSLANNHTGDYGDRALRQTLRLIDASPIAPVGAGRDARDAWRPVVLTSGGVRFGFVAFNAIGETPRATRTRPGAAEIRMQPRTGPLSGSDLARMSRIVSGLSERVDVVIVLPHWGDQYTNQPVQDQRVVGAALVEAGADLVVGGHPHWVQGVQTHRGGLIAHSLGNFVFDMDFSVPTQEGALLELVFWGDRLRGARFVPHVIGDDFAPRTVHGVRAQTILDRIWETSDPPFRN